MTAKKRVIFLILILIGFLVSDYYLIKVIREPIKLKVKGENNKIKKKIKSIERKPESIIKTEVKRRKTIEDYLKNFGFTKGEIYKLVKSGKNIYNLKKIKAGNTLIFKLEGNKLKSFTYFIDDKFLLNVEIDKDKYIFKKEKIPYVITEKILKGKIDTNLFDAIEKLGERDALALKLAYIFGWDIDFYTDLRKGDTFSLIVEKLFLDGKFKRYGDIKFATFTNRGKKFEAILFKFPDGSSDYYTPGGKSLRKQFLKSPLKFGRITSRFSYHRFHPILKRYMPHLGVDIAAPKGTPVHAAGDGIVVYAGWRGGAGKFIEIKHKNRYRTQYMHLSRIKRGIRRGKKVKQGEIIGYVGSTGLSTGPHLDYRIKKNGRYINPLSAKFKRAKPLPRKYLKVFKKLVKKYEKLMETY